MLWSWSYKAKFIKLKVPGQSSSAKAFKLKQRGVWQHIIFEQVLQDIFEEAFRDIFEQVFRDILE